MERNLKFLYNYTSILYSMLYCSNVMSSVFLHFWRDRGIGPRSKYCCQVMETTISDHGFLVKWWPRISLTTFTNDELLWAGKFEAGKLCKTLINNSDLSSSSSSTSQTSPPVSLPRMEEDQVSFCSSYQIYNLYQ